MDALLILLMGTAAVLTVIGLVGAVVPGIPGPPLNFVALVLMKCVVPEALSWGMLGVLCLLTVAVTLIDYVAPGWFTRLGGGSKGAVTGSIIGTVAGLFFFAPYGLIVGPFVGALVGQLWSDGSKPGRALRVACLAFLAFLVTTGLKFILSVVLTYYTILTGIAFCTT
jgi:uncharacterized protein YqgC (DUF456 family)